MNKKPFIIGMTLLVALLIIVAIEFRFGLLDDFFAKTYYHFFPIHIIAEFPEGIQQKIVSDTKEYLSEHFPGQEPFGEILVRPLSKIRKGQNTPCNIEPNGICIGTRINDKDPKGITIYDREMNRLGYIEWSESKNRTTWPDAIVTYFTSEVSWECFENPHKAVLEY